MSETHDASEHEGPEDPGHQQTPAGLADAAAELAQATQRVLVHVEQLLGLAQQLDAAETFAQLNAISKEMATGVAELRRLTESARTSLATAMSAIAGRFPN